MPSKHYPWCTIILPWPFFMPWQRALIFQCWMRHRPSNHSHFLQHPASFIQVHPSCLPSRQNSSNKLGFSSVERIFPVCKFLDLFEKKPDVSSPKFQFLICDFYFCLPWQKIVHPSLAWCTPNLVIRSGSRWLGTCDQTYFLMCLFFYKVNISIHESRPVMKNHRHYKISFIWSKHFAFRHTLLASK